MILIILFFVLLFQIIIYAKYHKISKKVKQLDETYGFHLSVKYTDSTNRSTSDI